MGRRRCVLAIQPTVPSPLQMTIAPNSHHIPIVPLRKYRSKDPPQRGSEAVSARGWFQLDRKASRDGYRGMAYPHKVEQIITVVGMSHCNAGPE